MSCDYTNDKRGNWRHSQEWKGPKMPKGKGIKGSKQWRPHPKLEKDGLRQCESIHTPLQD